MKKINLLDLLETPISNFITRIEIIEFMKIQNLSNLEIENCTMSVCSKILTLLTKKVLFDQGKTLQNNLKLTDEQMYYLPYIIDAIKEKYNLSELSLGMNPEDYGYFKKPTHTGSVYYTFEKSKRVKTSQELEDSFNEKLKRI
jgi:hypothetical protein